MISKEEFKAKFENSFFVAKKKYKNVKTFSIFWFVFSTILVVGACVGLSFFLDPNNESIPLFILIGLFAWFAFCALPILARKDRFVKKFKRKNIGEILKYIWGEDSFYLEQGFVSRTLFDKSRFTNQKYTNYSGEDLFVLEIKNRDGSVFLSGSDLIVEKITKDKQGKINVDKIFDGVFCAIKFKKQFKCILDINSCKKSLLQSLQTESNEFNTLFHVETNDQIEGRLILTLPMMQHLINLAKKAKCKIGLSFRDEYLFLYLNKELFNLPTDLDDLTFEFLEPIYNDIFLINEIVQEIIKNKKFFKN